MLSKSWKVQAYTNHMFFKIPICGSRSNMTVKSYGLDTDFAYVCIVNLTLEIWPWFKIMTHSCVTDNNCAYYIFQIQHGNKELWQGHGFWVCMNCDLDLRDMTLVQVHDTLLCHGQQLCILLSWSNLVVRSYYLDTDCGYVCTVTLNYKRWHWVKVMIHPWTMDNNCVKYPKESSEELFPGPRFWVCVNYDLDLGGTI